MDKVSLLVLVSIQNNRTKINILYNQSYGTGHNNYNQSDRTRHNNNQLDGTGHNNNQSDGTGHNNNQSDWTGNATELSPPPPNVEP